MSTIKAGDKVTIYSGGRRGAGWAGEVVKVGRTLAHIRYHGRVETFRLDSQVKTGMQTGPRTYFKTADDTALRKRREAAEALLKEHHITLEHRGTFTLEQVEALADVARTFGTDR